MVDIPKFKVMLLDLLKPTSIILCESIRRNSRKERMRKEMSDKLSNSVDRYGRAPTKMSSNNTDQPKKAVAGKRILACVLCQQRKKKRDRKSPCSNCIKVTEPRQEKIRHLQGSPLKLKIVCTPSTPAPPRKRKRPNQDLLERLARCEALLRRCTCIRLPTPESSPREQCEQSPVSSHDDGIKRGSSPEPYPHEVK